MYVLFMTGDITKMTTLQLISHVY